MHKRRPPWGLLVLLRRLLRLTTLREVLALQKLVPLLFPLARMLLLCFRVVCQLGIPYPVPVLQLVQRSLVRLQDLVLRPVPLLLLVLLKFF